MPYTGAYPGEPGYPPAQNLDARRYEKPTKEQKQYNATAAGQKEMCYAAGRKATLKALSDFIDSRHRERFKLMKRHHAGEIPYSVVEEFDEVTDKQERIHTEICNNPNRRP